MAPELMSNEIALLAIFILSVFVGFEVVSKVSTTLHTPLMWCKCNSWRDFSWRNCCSRSRKNYP